MIQQIQHHVYPQAMHNSMAAKWSLYSRIHARMNKRWCFLQHVLEEERGVGNSRVGGGGGLSLVSLVLMLIMDPGKAKLCRMSS